MNNFSVEQRLRTEVEIYSKGYENELKRSGVSEQEVKTKVAKWIDETCNFYKNNGYDLQYITKSFAMLNSGIEFQLDSAESDHVLAKTR